MKDVFCEMIVNLFVKKKGIHIIIYPVKGFQRICDVIFLQGYPCFLKLADIPGWLLPAETLLHPASSGVPDNPEPCGKYEEVSVPVAAISHGKLSSAERSVKL